MPRDRLKRRAALAPLVAVGLLVASCTGDGKTSTPSEHLPNAASLIPAAPAPPPTPTPGPVPEEEPIPVGPGSGSEVTGECGEPVPPPVSRINVKLHARQPGRAVLDATPLVGPDAAYCRQ